MKAAFAGIAALAVLTGCSSAPVLPIEKGLDVEWIGARPLVDRSHLTLTLGNDGRAYGTAGCNHWFAAYTLKGKHLHFSQPGSTRKVCAPALMEQEQRYLQALAGVERWDYGPQQQVRLWPAQGEPLQLFEQD